VVVLVKFSVVLLLYKILKLYYQKSEFWGITPQFSIIITYLRKNVKIYREEKWNNCKNKTK